ncbi:MAG: hypothetical protein KatS3mg082_1819 [Nitrospiraceae bacterium]|nr:MAG: hypothetical protein KatS3mg082_1819 [Nitrospiraceae bacterium]
MKRWTAMTAGILFFWRISGTSVAAEDLPAYGPRPEPRESIVDLNVREEPPAKREVEKPDWRYGGFVDVGSTSR